MPRKKIAIVVPNPCNPDYRVIRQAEVLAKAGYEVRLYATKNAHTPSFEEFNGVKYVRASWNVVRDYLSFLTGSYRRENPLEATRREHMRSLARARNRSKLPPPSGNG